jgi:hypothetical protein
MEKRKRINEEINRLKNDNFKRRFYFYSTKVYERFYKISMHCTILEYFFSKWSWARYGDNGHNKTEWRDTGKLFRCRR